MTKAVALKLGAFAAALGLAFAGAFTLGSTVDPQAAAQPAPRSDDPAGGHGGMDGTDNPPAEAGGHGDDHSTDQAAAALPGLAVSEAGYTFVPAKTFFGAGRQEPLRFTIEGPDGRPVTAYQETHEKDLHLIVVRRDLSGFRHVHPVRAADGTWSIPFEFGRGGTWRLFADFAPAGLGRTLTLGTDVNVAGPYAPLPLPAASSKSSRDGYDVTLAGEAVAGKESELTFTVSRGGRPVSDLQPYLGAFGHLVSLRSGDLAYLHNHPAETAEAGDSGGPEVRFGTTFPTAGTYRLYLDFQHAGTVHTAEFTVTVGATGNGFVEPTKAVPTKAVPTKAGLTKATPTGAPTKGTPTPGAPRSTPTHAASPHGH